MTDKSDHLAERAAALLRAGNRAPIPHPFEVARSASPEIRIDAACARARPASPQAARRGPAQWRMSAQLKRVELGVALQRAGTLAVRCKPAARAWSRRGIKLAVAVVPWAYLTTVVWAQAAGGGASGGLVSTAPPDSSGLRALLERLEPGALAPSTEKAWNFSGALNVSVGAQNGNGFGNGNGNGQDDWSFVGVVQPEFNVTGDTRRLAVRLYYSPVLSFYGNGQGTHISHNLSGDATVAIVPDWFYFDLRAYAADLPRYGGYYYGAYGSGTTGYGSNLITPLLTNNTSEQSATVSATPYLLHTFDGWGTARLGYSLTRTWLGDNSTSSLPGYGTGGNLTTNRQFGEFTTGENFNRFSNDFAFAADQYSGGSSIYEGAHDFAVTDTASYAVTRWFSALASAGYETLHYSGTGGFSGDYFNWTVGARVIPNPDSQLTIQYGHREGEYTVLFNGNYTPTPKLSLFGSYNTSITTYLQRLQSSLSTTVVGPSGVLVDQTTGTPVNVVSPFGIYNGVSRVKVLSAGASYILTRDAFALTFSREEDTSLSPSVSSTGTAVSAGVTGTGTAGSISWQHDLSPDTSLTSSFTYGVSDNGAFVGSPGSSTDYWSLTSQLTHRFTPTLSGSASFSHAEQFGASGSAANVLNSSQNLILVGLRKTF